MRNPQEEELPDMGGSPLRFGDREWHRQENNIFCLGHVLPGAPIYRSVCRRKPGHCRSIYLVRELP